jgi:hypothetical protein
MTQSAEDGEDGQGTRGEESRGRGERLARSLFSRVSGTLSALLARIAHTHARCSSYSPSKDAAVD